MKIKVELNLGSQGFRSLPEKNTYMYGYNLMSYDIFFVECSILNELFEHFWENREWNEQIKTSAEPSSERVNSRDDGLAMVHERKESL